MAAIQFRAGTYRILFRYQGKQFTYPVGQVSDLDAEIALTKVKHWLGRIKARLVAPPQAENVVAFIQNDGALPGLYQPPVKKAFTLAMLRDEYLQLHASVLAEQTVTGMAGHWKHLGRHLDVQTEAEALALPDLQRYVMARIGEGVEPATAKKEIITLRTCWNWGVRMSMLAQPFPNKGLRFPKGKEKPPFMTFDEVTRRIATGEPESLWESVFLTRPDIEAFLESVKARAAYPWIYPMFCFAAHTGARCGELLRLRVNDVDLIAATVLIRERKRRRDVTESTRRVPLSPFLLKTLRKWLDIHPVGPFLFCHAGVVGRSKKRSKTTGHKGQKTRATTEKGRKASVRERAVQPESALSRTEAYHHLNWTLEGTKWENLKGYHVLRHSFISNCAAAGVDQRLIDAWVGHTTEEMRRRYRHLIPSVEQQAIKQVFG